MGWLIAHGVMDGILAIFIFLLGIMANSLRDTLKEGQEQQRKLAEAISALNLTVGKDYVSRAEHDKDTSELWDKLERLIEKVEDLTNALSAMKGATWNSHNERKRV